MFIGLAAVVGLLVSPSPGATQAPSTPPARRATVEGTVFDSLARAPLAGATVSFVLEGDATTARSTTSDSAGHYVLRDLEPGVYLAGFFHPLMDSIGVEPPLRRVTISDRSGTTRVNLGVPSARTIREAVCGTPSTNDSSGVFVGHVQDASTRAFASGARVVAQWARWGIGDGALARTLPTLVATTSATGWFAFCDLPPETDIAFLASSGADSSGIITYAVSALSLVHHDFYIAPVERVARANAPDSSRADDSLPVPTEALRRGPARMHGIVREASHGTPLPGVQVGIAGTGLTATTNEQGEFALGQLPPGTQTLFARKVGFFPSEQVVNLFADEASPLMLTLPTVESVLDTVKITARRMYSADRDGFYRRQYSGWGTYFDANQIARIHPFSTGDLLRRVPGVRIDRGASDERALVRGSTSRFCEPTIFIDGMPMRWITLRDLDMMVPPDAIKGMEVYTTAIGLPARFMMGFQSCGAIVVWTQAPLRAKR